MKDCHLLCRHREAVREYHHLRHGQQCRAESFSGGNETELTEFYETVESKITFKKYLIDRTGAAQQHYEGGNPWTTW
jgi:hypothetical protein